MHAHVQVGVVMLCETADEYVTNARAAGGTSHAINEVFQEVYHLERPCACTIEIEGRSGRVKSIVGHSD